MTYKHTQIGYVLAVAMAVMSVVAFIMVTLDPGEMWPASLVVILGVVVVWLFSSLSVIVDEHRLYFFFGPGVIRKSYSLKDIQSCQVVKNSWLCGWGIHLTRHGWLFNVSGFKAIEIILNDGKQFRLGTDEPEKLCQAILDYKK